jgi:hypothetical protein
VWWHPDSESGVRKSQCRWKIADVKRPKGRYLFSVAQIFNLPYRLFVIGRALLAGDRWQVKNLRYSRLQVCATGSASTLNTYKGRAPAEILVAPPFVLAPFRRRWKL